MPYRRTQGFALQSGYIAPLLGDCLALGRRREPSQPLRQSCHRILQPRLSAARSLKEQEVIQSQIDGEFNGWEGDTLVKLVNGQVWQQSEYWYHYHYAYMPKVTIITSGGYKMQVAGTPRAIRVTRLK